VDITNNRNLTSGSSSGALFQVDETEKTSYTKNSGQQKSIQPPSTETKTRLVRNVTLQSKKKFSRSYQFHLYFLMKEFQDKIYRRFPNCNI